MMMLYILFAAGLFTSIFCGWDALVSEYTFKTRALGYGMALGGWALMIFAVLMARY